MCCLNTQSLLFAPSVDKRTKKETFGSTPINLLPLSMSLLNQYCFRFFLSQLVPFFQSIGVLSIIKFTLAGASTLNMALRKVKCLMNMSATFFFNPL